MIEDTPEISAMSNVFTILKGLDKPQLKRIVHWVKDRFDLKKNTIYFDPPPTEQAQTAPPVKKELSQIETGMIPAPENEQNPEDSIPKTKGLDDYNTVLDILTESKANKPTKQILLIAAFLQVRFKYEEVSVHDISFRMKRMGHEVKNIMIPISEILQKNPPLMLEVQQEDGITKSRKKFIVTKRGLKVASSYLVDPDEEKKPRKKREKKDKKEKLEKKTRKKKKEKVESMETTGITEIKEKKKRGPRGPYKKRENA